MVICFARYDLGGGNSKILYFHPDNLGKRSNLTCAYFSEGWEPPTRFGFHEIWSNYRDFTRVFTPNGLVREMGPLISGKSSLVKYYDLDLMRWNHLKVGTTPDGGFQSPPGLWTIFRLGNPNLNLWVFRVPGVYRSRWLSYPVFCYDGAWSFFLKRGLTLVSKSLQQ